MQLSPGPFDALGRPDSPRKAVSGAAEASAPGGPDLAAALDAQGWASWPGLVSAEDCIALREAYARDDAFRSRIVMQQHGFGRGEYKYFAYPLPPLVAALRERLYARLAPIANRWNEALGSDARYPLRHADYLARCHAAGQRRPTPLLLRYGPGDHNCLHQDVYGEHLFPLQAVVLLARPGVDFDGGELVLTEQRPRMQSRVAVLPLARGDAAVIPVRHRPVQGVRGAYRATVRHGVSAVRSGERHALGIIFHDAA